MGFNKKNKYLNKKYTTNEGYSVQVIDYFHYQNVTIQFESGHILENRNMDSILKGGIKNPYHKSVNGIGYIGQGKYSAKEHKHQYMKWHGMFIRCYNIGELKKHPTYVGCYICEEWHNFQVFAKWFDENYNDEIMNSWHLDKDILTKRNKIYGPDTCCFVPSEINSLFILRKYGRGKYPIGICLRKNSFFQARVSSGQASINIGFFKSVEEAFEAYKKAKENIIKEMAEKWKDKISTRTYIALKKYKIEIDE